MKRDTVWARIRERAWGDGDASSVQGKPRLGIERLTRSGRTRNMLLMSVTLDVSILSGWLNADASCRVERRAYESKGGHTSWDEVRARIRDGRGGDGGASGVQGVSHLGIGRMASAGAHKTSCTWL